MHGTQTNNAKMNEQMFFARKQRMFFYGSAEHVQEAVKAEHSLSRVKPQASTPFQPRKGGDYGD